MTWLKSCGGCGEMDFPVVQGIKNNTKQGRKRQKKKTPPYQTTSWYE